MKITDDAFNLRYRLHDLQIEATVQQLREMLDSLLEAQEEMVVILDSILEDDDG